MTDDLPILTFRKKLLDTKESLLRQTRRAYLKESKRIGVDNVQSALNFLDEETLGHMMHPDYVTTQAALRSGDTDYEHALENWRAVEKFCNGYFECFHTHGEVPIDRLHTLLETLRVEANEEIGVTMDELDRMKTAATEALAYTVQPMTTR